MGRKMARLQEEVKRGRLLAQIAWFLMARYLTGQEIVDGDDQVALLLLAHGPFEQGEGVVEKLFLGSQISGFLKLI